MKTKGLTRRQMLKGGGIAVAGAGAGLAGYVWPHEQAAAATIDIGGAPATPDDSRGVCTS